MSRNAGLRQVLAAVAFRFCAWRADTALGRSALWERRALECRRYGEDA